MNEKEKRQALRMIPYGMYVLTAHTDDTIGLNAATVSWLSQASFNPPRIVVALRKESGIWYRVQSAGTFVVNLLGTGQKDLASTFFRPVEPQGDRLGGYKFHSGASGAPILDDAAATLECTVVQAIDAGDHSLFLADILQASVQNDLSALSLAETGWHYGG